MKFKLYSVLNLEPYSATNMKMFTSIKPFRMIYYVQITCKFLIAFFSNNLNVHKPLNVLGVFD